MASIVGVLAAVTAVSVATAVVRPGDACAALPGGAHAAGPVPGVSYAGQATNYELRSGGGNCSYPGPPDDQLYVALSPGEYAAAGACGGYLDVTGPSGSVRVKVVDQCPECNDGHIDLSRRAFARIGALPDGIINVRYRLARDPAVPAGLSYRVKEGSSRYWLALLPDNHGNPVARLEVRSGSGWLRLSRADYNYWIAEQGAGPGPFTVRLTDIFGAQVTSTIGLRVGAVQTVGGAPRRAPATAPRATPARPSARSTAPARPPASPLPSPTARPSPPESSSDSSAASAARADGSPSGCR